MPGLPNLRHAYAIARTTVLRGWRKTVGKNRVQLGAFAVAVLFGLGFTAAATVGAYWAGRALATNPGEARDLAGLVPAGLATFTVFLTAYITAVQGGDIEARDGYLTTVPARDVVGGLLASGFLRTAGIFAGPLLVASAGFAVGAGAPLAFPLAALAVLAVTTTAYLVGYPVGVGAAYVASRSKLFERYKAAIGVLAFVAYFGLVVTNTLGSVFEPFVEAARASPVAWYADLPLLAVTDTASAVKAASVLAGSAVVAVLGVLASVRLSEKRWYSDAVAGTEREQSSATGGRLDALLGRRTAWVARKSWLRARRAPIKLVYVVYPLFVLLQPIQASVEAGRVTSTLPTVVALYGAWMTGAAFTLNPLGDEGSVLPVTVTTAVSGRQFAGGLVVASAAVGLPITLAATAVLAALSPLPPLAAACTVVAAAVLPALAAGVAVGVGSQFPKYESTSMGRNREVVVPSTWGFVVYTLVFLVTAGFATGLQVPGVATAIADALGVADAAVHVGSLAFGVLLAGVAAVLGFRTAVRVFDDWTTESRG